eukprot:TRINITY_DN92293_c0_g1_i1.p1 TRINITY_DN92293_c0_g1~~TRINITY_DN92293_c0_g1_i1.p1  ORF type:complete len:176 (+),score=30.43 TRINITY_DN92293_c0_g1_i1:112-639(+)
MSCFSLAWAVKMGVKSCKSSKYTITVQGCRAEVQEPVLRRREDPHSEWTDYNPDTDPYDVRTAPIEPPCESAADKIASKQIAALRSRISKGGDESVLRHYETVLYELEGSLTSTNEKEEVALPAPRSQGRFLKLPPLSLTHKRCSSGASDSSSTSTRCSETPAIDSRASSQSPRL